MNDEPRTIQTVNIYRLSVTNQVRPAPHPIGEEWRGTGQMRCRLLQHEGTKPRRNWRGPALAARLCRAWSLIGSTPSESRSMNRNRTFARCAADQRGRRRRPRGQGLRRASSLLRVFVL